MGESYIHVKHVSKIIDWININYIDSVIFFDSSASKSKTKPQKIGDHVPDVFARNYRRNVRIIGEAKTANDIENEHTLNQLRAFLNHCKAFPGSIFVLAVPWDMVPCANNLINRLDKELCFKQNVKIEILPC